jgi:transposase
LETTRCWEGGIGVSLSCLSPVVARAAPGRPHFGACRSVIDLSGLRAEVAELYSAENGRPGIDPEVAVRLMLAGFLLGIVHDRRLMREAQVNLSIRGFIGYALHEPLPDHSSLTRIRRRWGADRFRHIFERTVKACIATKIATGEVVHVDASLIRANVSWESLARRHVEAVSKANEPSSPENETKVKGRQTGQYKKVCVTDPDASMATNGRNRRLEPAYKQHAVVDDVRGVILDVEVTTGETNEGQVIIERIDAAATTTGRKPVTVTADAGYAYGKVYGDLEERGIDPVIPAKAEPIRSTVPLRRFRYDAKHDILRCPRSKILRPGRPIEHGRFSTQKSATARAAPWHRSACPKDAAIRPWWSATITQRCCELVDAAFVGQSRSSTSTVAIAGDPKASTGRPRPGTVSLEPCAGASRICASSRC